MLESPNLRRIWLGVSALSRVFRMNSGMGWTGEVRRLPNGDILIRNPRPLTAGFSTPDAKPLPGPGDLIGVTPVVVTQDMVGSTIGVFTSFEVKREGGGSVRKAQKTFMQTAAELGCITGVVRDPTEAVDLIEKFKGVRRLI